MGKLLLLLAIFSMAMYSQAQITCDGNIIEAYWGMPLATSTGGPLPCIGSNARLNSLYAAANDSSILIGVGGNIQNGHPLVLFIDSKVGGVQTGNFNRNNAPACLQNLPAGTAFDADFTADYSIIISNNATTSTVDMQLFALAANITIPSTIASIAPSGTVLGAGCSAGMVPSADDFTKGYELKLPRTWLGYNPQTQAVVKYFAVIMNEDGSMMNQFLTPAASTAIGCFGKGVSGAGIQFQQDANINPVAFNPSRSLPIDFIDVKAFQTGATIKVFWTSATEKEMQEYQVERSDDAMQYTVVGQVAARGNNTSQTNYAFTDAQPLLGKSYYRIRATDRNGRSTYSTIVKMQFGRVDNTLTIYPNPVKDQINLQIVGLKPDTYHLQVFNDIGQCMIDRTIVYTGGYGLQQISLLPNMQKGPYRLLLRNKTWFYKQNFLVQ